MTRRVLYTAALALVAALGVIAFPSGPDELDIARHQFDSARQAEREQAAERQRAELFKTEARK